MKRLLSIVSLVILSLLAGCQSMGDHFSCMAEVDRTIPAQTQQRYLRTDTKCTKSNEQSLGGGMGTIYNPAQGDVSCSSTPVYETIVLNQAERDSAYQRCRGGISSQRASASASVPYQQFTDAEWQEKLNKNKNNPAYLESMKRIKCQEMGYPAGTSEWKKCVASFPN